jgi:hypothetical protein
MLMENFYERKKALQTMVVANTCFVLQWLIGLLWFALFWGASPRVP